MLDPFYLKSKEETKKIISDFWEDLDLEYLTKIKILLKAFPGYSITKLESRGIEKMWKGISLSDKKEIYRDQWKYQR